MGKKALADKDENAWADANRRLGEVRDRITAAQERAERRRRPQTQEPPPDPRTIKLKLGLHLTQLREEARRRGRLVELETDFQTCDATLRSIDPAAADALDRLLDYFHNLYQPLESKVLGSKAKAGDQQSGWVRVLNEASRNR
jgi:phytoene dehydrogenase-like protein